MTYAHAKGKGQKSVGSKDGTETDGQMEALALPTVLTRSLIIQPSNIIFNRINN